MLSLEDCYQIVYVQLKRYYDQFESINTSIKKLPEQQNSDVEKINNEMNKIVSKNKDKRKILTAFINIAMNHCRNLKDASDGIPYDETTLKKLQVQINENLPDDLYAGKLYTEATGQLKYLADDETQIVIEFKNRRNKMLEESQHQWDSLEHTLTNLYEAYTNYFQESEFISFIHRIENRFQTFGLHSEIHTECNISNDGIDIGTIKFPFPIPCTYHDVIKKLTCGLFDPVNMTIDLPVKLNFNDKSVIIAEYQNEIEEMILKGIQNLLLNIAKYDGDSYDQICFIDPVRYNNSSLGALRSLSIGSNSFIHNVPASPNEITKILKELVLEINEFNEALMDYEHHYHRRLYIFHDFPQSYDQNMINQIQQLCISAKYYGISVILTHNKSLEQYSRSDTLARIQVNAINILYNETSFQLKINESSMMNEFMWYQAPNELPKEVAEKCIAKRSKSNNSNDYNERIGILSENALVEKGNRFLSGIPFAIDMGGNIITIDFEHSNFATFICGSARSGKSTLLHTLITGLVKSLHPDDIEIWLIDFKMTEFSRYTSDIPPHVRYIILDESPELVYDIIDRLTEILKKRQDIFKGKWTKLYEVPIDKYMPSMFIMIDEFSIMSQIIADSQYSNSENYVYKFQSLLAKGSALGIHFVFASQGFTTGTKGLNDFSKKQIQQRVAMKTDYLEIKETLDLKSTSEDDRALMEQLPVHHALIRIPVNEKGNHALLTKVLYISDFEVQTKLIHQLNKQYQKVKKYDMNNSSAYIDKKPLIIDGNVYTSFLSQQSELEKIIFTRQKQEDDETVLFIGEARRMIQNYPISVMKGFSENLIILGSNREKSVIASILCSIAHCLTLQDYGIELWTSKRITIFQETISQSSMDCFNRLENLEEICKKIHAIKSAILRKEEAKHFYILTGFESIMLEMQYLLKNESDAESYLNPASNSILSEKFEGRKRNEPDLITRLKIAKETGNLIANSENIDKKSKETDIQLNDEIKVYDARDDLKFILEQGSRLGYHFILIYNSINELNQSRIDLTYFKHKILFRMSKQELSGAITLSQSSVISELKDHIFRYTNGLESISFRPYLHTGLSWDGWQVNTDGTIDSKEDEEEYLL